MRSWMAILALGAAPGFLCVAGCDGGDGDGLTEVPGEWITISSRSFTMGSPPDELGRYDEEMQHEVTLTRDYELGSTEVTRPQFEEVMGYDPSARRGCADCPVQLVSWYEAAAYCNALSRIAGFSRCYRCTGSGESVECEPSDSYSSPYDCPGYRLPTEAEWEHAARAGTTTATYNGDLDSTGCMSTVLERIAWYCGNSGFEPHAVGRLEANGWGLYDMLGNVDEWCHDWYDDYPASSVTDPWGPAAGPRRTIRGGNWADNANLARAAIRIRRTPDQRSSEMGFRVSRSLP